MSWTQEKIAEIYNQAERKATTDVEFRKKLLTDTEKAIEELAGEKLPEGMKLRVVENDPAYNATFVLPDFVGDELEDDALDEVAGGVFSEEELKEMSSQAEESSVSMMGMVCVGGPICGAAVDIGACPAYACAANVKTK